MFTFLYWLMQQQCVSGCTKHDTHANPQALLLISGDFNHTSHLSIFSTFVQYVKCHIRENKTLDLCANVKDTYTSNPLPLLGHSITIRCICFLKRHTKGKKRTSTEEVCSVWRCDEASERLEVGRAISAEQCSRRVKRPKDHHWPWTNSRKRGS